MNDLDLKRLLRVFLASDFPFSADDALSKVNFFSPIYTT
jgi:hypothetical protein